MDTLLIVVQTNTHKDYKSCQFKCKHPYKHKMCKLTHYNITSEGFSSSDGPVACLSPRWTGGLVQSKGALGWTDGLAKSKGALR
jgi:hypothetical protein